MINILSIEFYWPHEGPHGIPCINLSVYLFIRLARVSLWNRSLKFFDFLHEVRTSSNLKGKGARFF